MAMFFFIYYKSNQWLKIQCNWKIISKHLIITSIFIAIYIMTTKTLFISIGFTVIYISIFLFIQDKTKIFMDLKYLKSSFNDV